jgi:hypothetical protein
MEKGSNDDDSIDQVSNDDDSVHHIHWIEINHANKLVHSIPRQVVGSKRFWPSVKHAVLHTVWRDLDSAVLISAWEYVGSYESDRVETYPSWHTREFEFTVSETDPVICQDAFCGPTVANTRFESSRVAHVPLAWTHLFGHVRHPVRLRYKFE